MQILRIKDVMAKTGLSRASIYKQQAAGNFPRSISLTGLPGRTRRAIGWYAYEVDVWLQGRMDARDAAPKPGEAYGLLSRHQLRWQ